MKLWKISQSQNTTWDVYRAAVVAAETESEARSTDPYDGSQITNWDDAWLKGYWCHAPNAVTVEYLGEGRAGMKAGIVLSDFGNG